MTPEQRSLTLLLAAVSGLDERTCRLAVVFGPDDLRNRDSQERSKAGLAELMWAAVEETR